MVAVVVKRTLFVVSRRLSSSGDLLDPRLFSAFRLRVHIFWTVGRRRRRMMLRLAFVEYTSIFRCSALVQKVICNTQGRGKASRRCLGFGWRKRYEETKNRPQDDASKAH